MTQHHARLIAVAIAAVSFSPPITAQQETVDEFQALEWFTGQPGVLAMKIEKSRSEDGPTDMIGGGTLIVSSVALELQSVGFIGVASSTRINAHASPPVVTRDADVVVPLDAFQRFLETLLQAPVKEGIYRPSVPRTGGSPKTRVELNLETETVTFFTESLADGGIPWGATFGGRTYVIESDIPSKALRILDPYISLDDSSFRRLDRLQEPTPPPTLEALMETLLLSPTQVTDAGLVHLAGLTALEGPNQGLNLSYTQVTDAGLVHLAGSRYLEGLNLSYTQVTGPGLAHLAGLTALEMLYLQGTPITDAGLVHLSGLTALEELDLWGTQVTDAGLAHLAGLTALERLDLVDTQVTDAGLAHLTGLTALEHLYLDGTQVTDAGVAKLQQALPNCSIDNVGPVI